MTGSQTFLHLSYAEQRWVGLVQGVHDIAVGHPIDVWVSPAHLYLFDLAGRLAAAGSGHVLGVNTWHRSPYQISPIVMVPMGYMRRILRLPKQ